MDNYLSIPVEEFTFSEVKEDNRFVKIELKFIHDGENLNKSFISLETIKQATDKSLVNIPILADFNEDESDFTTHTENEQGVGIIPQLNNDLRFEKDKSNGKIYGYVTGYIWRHYSKSTVDILENAKDKTTGCSIEIEVLKGHKDRKKGYYVIESFVFLGITLLGSNVQTGMELAQATIFSQESKEKYFNQIRELSEELNLYFSSHEENQILQISTENFSENINNTLIQGEKEGNLMGFNKEEFALKFGLTTNQIYEELYKAICNQEMICTDWGYEMCRFCMRDYDETYVYCSDCKEGEIIRVPFSFLGDNVSVDFTKAERVKTQYVLWEGEDATEEDEMSYAKKQNEIFLSEIKAKKEECEAISLEFDKSQIDLTNMKNDLEKANEELITVKADCEKFSNDLTKVIEDLNTANSELTTAKTDYIEVTKNFSALQEAVKIKDTEIDSLKLENENLNTFKLDSAREERKSKALSIFNDNLGLLSSEEIEKFTKEAEDIEDFTVFETKLQSFLFVRSKEINKGITSDVNFSYVPNANKPSDSQNKDENRWAVYSKEYNK